MNLLAAYAPVPPDIPVPAEALFLAQVADLGARDALVVAVVPLADGLGHLDAGTAVVGDGLVRRLRAVLVPRQWVLDAQVQQLEGALSTLARRDVAV